MGPEVIIATLVPISFFAMIFGIVYLRSRENMGLIDKGFNPRKNEPKAWPFVNLKYGLLMIGAGSGLLIAYLVDTFVLGHRMKTTATAIESNGDNPALYFALIAISGGLGLFFSYKIERKDWLEKNKGHQSLESSNEQGI